MKSIIVIFTLSACILGTAYAAPYPGSSEIALLNGMTSGKQIGGETRIQERKDAEAQFVGKLVSILLPLVINALAGGVTIQKTEDVNDLQTLLANIESSSMDEEVKVQGLIGDLLKGAVKLGPPALELIKALSDLVNGVGGSTQPQESENSAEDINDLQTLLANIESSSMDEEAKVQGLASLFGKLGPKALQLLKAGGRKAWDFADKLTPGLLASDLINAIRGSTQPQESEDNRLQMLQAVPHYEKLFKLLNQLEAKRDFERDLEKEAKASFFAAGLQEDSAGK